MRDFTRRLNALEDRRHPQQVHVVTTPADADENDAIDAYGRDCIRREDLTIVIRRFGEATPS